jgi:organic radical activating enzyme
VRKPTKWNIATNTPDPSCGYKWGWSTVNLTAGNTNSCHRVEADEIRADNFADFHNTKKKQVSRLAMKEGKWPGMGCEYCRDIETAGGTSDRLEFNNSESKQKFIPKELTGSGYVPTKVTPTILEMYFTNLCNLGCVYCSPVYSSVIEAETKRFPTEFDFKLHPSSVKEGNMYSDRVAAFWNWFRDNVHELKQYNILGGEPFFQPELIHNLEFFEQRVLPELTVQIVSNLKVPEKKFRNILERFQKLKTDKKLHDLRIVCSLDCWGPQQEYIRSGLNIQNWERNFNILLHEFPEIKLEIHGTMTGLSIKTMPILMSKLKKWNTIRRVNTSYNLCFDPAWYHPGVFQNGFFDADFERAYRYMDFDDSILDMVQGLQKTINSARVDNDMVNRLRIELEGNDRRRGTNFKPLFPWLEDYCEANK